MRRSMSVHLGCIVHPTWSIKRSLHESLHACMEQESRTIPRLPPLNETTAYEDVTREENLKLELTMISRRVSRLTLKGMFLMTIAVGIISSSAPWPSAPGMLPGVEMFGSGGEPPPEERSELLGGREGAIIGVHGRIVKPLLERCERIVA